MVGFLVDFGCVTGSNLQEGLIIQPDHRAWSFCTIPRQVGYSRESATRIGPWQAHAAKEGGILIRLALLTLLSIDMLVIAWPLVTHLINKIN